MKLIYLVPSLAMVAAAMPSLTASEISVGNDVKLRVGLRLQSRVEFADVSNAAGDDASLSGTATDDADQFNMYLRRVRFGVSGSYQDDTRFNLTLMRDNLGRLTGESNNNMTADFAVRYAWVSHAVKSDDMTHTFKFGLDKPFFCAGDIDSSSRMLFPTNRVASALSGPRRIGLSYVMTHPMVKLGVDLQDANGNALWFSARAETSLNEEWKMRRTESMLGKEGFGHVLGIEVGLRTDDDGNDDTDFVQFGIDYNVHFNNITANADFVMRTWGDSDIDDQMIFSVQGGYAIPLESGHVVEPALRLSYIDFGDDDPTGLPSFEAVNSGFQVDAGLNYYIKGHNNKLNFAVTHWSADKGDADKTIVRLQHQLNF